MKILLLLKNQNGEFSFCMLPVAVMSARCNWAFVYFVENVSPLGCGSPVCLACVCKSDVFGLCARRILVTTISLLRIGHEQFLECCILRYFC